MTLSALEAQIRRELAYIDYPPVSWMPQRGLEDHAVFDVVIVGAGQSGLAAAFGLMREQVCNILVLDRAREGQEGPWTTFARMVTLRTPKMVSGLDFGMPALTFRAWYETQWGHDAWNALGKIPRELWQTYLHWYRRVLQIPVRNSVDVASIRPDGALIAIETAGGEVFRTRKVVLATGLDGGGAWVVPKIVTTALPADRYAHTADEIDFTKLAGRRVGVLGNGASAFDNAATALENGAASVDLCLRKPTFPRVNAHRWMEFAGFLGHYATLPDQARWRFMRKVTSMSQPPPRDTLLRCRNHKGFRIHPDAAWTAITLTDGAIEVTTPHRRFTFDFLICGTGIANDPGLRPELAAFADKIALWSDKFAAPPDEADTYLARAPYLGRAFEFVEKEPGTAPYLANIHNFTYGATLSMGLLAASISGMKYGIPRLVAGIVEGLFHADAEWHLDRLDKYEETEFTALDVLDDATPAPALT